MNSCFLIKCIKLSIFDKSTWSLRDDYFSEVHFEATKTLSNLSFWDSDNILKLKIYFPVDVE